ncbi:MAG: hypothetical protein HXY24_10370, partial [Rubrivivax sp.]|nr:hypothetical protein [Rubrivivax sp.]
RYETANGLALDIERHLKHEPVTARPPSTVYRARKFLRRNRVLVTVATMAVCLVALITDGVFFWLRQTHVEWAKNQAVPEVERLLEQGAVTWDYPKARQALQLAQRASRHLPNEPRLEKAMAACSGLWSMKSDPSGAQVRIKPYGDPSADWEALGQTPLQDIRLARGFYLVRFEKPGFEPVEAVCGLSGGELSRKLDPAVFEIYKARFDYDPADLKAKVEKRDESAADWIVERVTFDATYDNERVIAELYLPRNGRKPYQSVILFPAADAVGGWLPASTRGYFGIGLDCFLKSGRAFVFPVYHGTYERTGDMTILKRWPMEEYRHAYTDHLALAGGPMGEGVGGGVYVYAPGILNCDPTTVIRKNHASTGSDNVGP